MKAYKIDLSMFSGKTREIIGEAVQKKALALGYTKNKLCPVTARYLFVPGILGMGWDDSRVYFQEDEGEEITAVDFLALECVRDVPEFKPFDKVLVRDRDEQVWRCDFFSHMDTEEEGVPFATVCAYWKQCIPYEGNEHLVGTTGVYNG